MSNNIKSTLFESPTHSNHCLVSFKVENKFDEYTVDFSNFNAHMFLSDNMTREMRIHPKIVYREDEPPEQQFLYQ